MQIIEFLFIYDFLFLLSVDYIFKVKYISVGYFHKEATEDCMLSNNS